MASSTVLRFVTVRNARKPRADELERHFVFYEENVKANLVVEARKAWPEGRRAVRGVIAEYVRSASEYISDRKELEQLAGGLVAWGEWMLRLGNMLDADAVKRRLRDDPVEISEATHRALWENLLAYTYVGGEPEVREGVIAALRTLNLRHVREEMVDDDEAVRALANATVVLPTLGPKHAPSQGTGEGRIRSDGGKSPSAADAEQAGGDGSDEGDTGPEGGESGDDERGPSGERNEIALLEKAHHELLQSLRREIGVARTAEAPPPPIPRARLDETSEFELPPDDAGAESERIGVVEAKKKATFSAETRETLANLGFHAEQDLRVPDAIAAIERFAEEVVTKKIVDPRAGRSVIEVGGAFWMAEAAPRRGVRARAGMARVAGRKDLEYKQFFRAEARDLDRDEEDEECQIKPLGVADYRRVEQDIHCYEPGEVAHIENVIEGETKERVTRRLRRTEEVATFETEEEQLEERDTQTTDRYEIEKETERAVQEDVKFELGVNVQAQYGVVKVTADSKFAYAQSTKESDRIASNFAREIVDRALERVTRRVREERVAKTLEEFEETNTHRIVGEGGHTVGLYRWLNKVYRAKVVNYGKRLVFQFLTPEPGAFHLFTAAKEPVENIVRIEKPVDPRSQETVSAYNVPEPLKDASRVSTTNYAMWAAIYNALVEPPPPYELTISKAYHRDGMDQNVQFADSKNDLKLPEGYEAAWFWTSYGLHSEVHDGGPNWITLVFGRWSTFTSSGGSFEHSLDGEDDFVPVVIMGRTRFYAVNAEVKCIRTDKALRAWQVKTFDAVISAYQDRLAAYENAFAEARARAGVEIRGMNPLRNREVEMTELKKGSIRLMTKCQPFASDAMKDPDPSDPCATPEFDCCEAIQDGSFVQFVEQAFEWSLMTYVFYPYFWASQCKWQKIYELDDVDPIFLTFLQAGYARVLVPVRPGYEEAAMRFLADGTPWNGGSVPGIDSEMYLAIANEMKERVGTVDPEIEPWDVVVPTSLTVLQCQSGCVPGTGLPCPGEEDETGGERDRHGPKEGNRVGGGGGAGGGSHVTGSHPTTEPATGQGDRRSRPEGILDYSPSDPP